MEQEILYKSISLFFNLINDRGLINSFGAKGFVPRGEGREVHNYYKGRRCAVVKRKGAGRVCRVHCLVPVGSLELNN